MLAPWAKQSKGGSIHATRGGGRQGSGLEYVRQQVRACWLLGETSLTIDRLSAAGEDVASFQTFLPSWWQAVTLPQESWTGSAQSEKVVIAPDTLATLAGFAAYLDKTQLQPFEATKESVEQSRDALADLLDLLQSQELRVSPDGRTYVFALLDEVRTMLDASAGMIDLDLIRRIHELQGFLSTLASDLEFREADNKVAVRLRQIIRRVTPIAIPVASVAGYMLGVASDTLALTAAVLGDTGD